MSDPRAEQMAAIRARADAATPGPWDIKGHEVVRESDGLPCIQSLWVADVDSSHPDAAFIAASRTDVHALLDIIDQQAKRLALAETTIADAQHPGSCEYWAYPANRAREDHCTCWKADYEAAKEAGL